MASRIDDIAAGARERFPEAVVEARHDLGTDVLVVRRDDIVGVCTWLRDDFGFGMLMDLSACDWLPREPRFDVNLQLYDLAGNQRLGVKVQLPADDAWLPSLCGVWPTVNWHEREVYDFFGIRFTGHPDLKRIFMPDEWIGHPLLKDYPVGGVPVEYKIEPAYVGDRVVSAQSRPSAGGLPARLSRDRGERSVWTWTGPPASGVRIPSTPVPPPDHPPEDAEGGDED